MARPIDARLIATFDNWVLWSWRSFNWFLKLTAKKRWPSAAQITLFEFSSWFFCLAPWWGQILTAHFIIQWRLRSCCLLFISFDAIDAKTEAIAILQSSSDLLAVHKSYHSSTQFIRTFRCQNHQVAVSIRRWKCWIPCGNQVSIKRWNEINSKQHIRLLLRSWFLTGFHQLWERCQCC